MPRKARVDYPGALHHVIGRGIERRFVLAESEEKYFFLERLMSLCGLYGFRCYAWSLMDNHVLCGAPHKTCNVKFIIM